MTRRIAFVAAAIFAIAACSTRSQPDQTPRAILDAGWPVVPADVKFGQVSAVDVDASGQVYVLHRAGRKWSEPFPSEPIAEPTVFVFDSVSGEIVGRWGAGEFIMPHGLSIDRHGKVWITDVAREQVFRFSKDGKLELTLGERGVTGSDAAHFGRPTDVAFVKDEVLVADGYLNHRIVVFDRKGRFLRQWGHFNVPHAIAVGCERIYVADRENARIQVFDYGGKLVATRTSPNGDHTYGVKAFAGLGDNKCAGLMLAVEGRDGANRSGAIVRVYEADGSINRSLDFGLEGHAASLGHDIASGPDDWIYVADVYGDRVVRYRTELD